MSRSTPDEWYYRQYDRELGPVSFASLAALARSGRLRPNDEVRSSRSTAGQPAREVDGLFTSLADGVAAAELEELQDLSELDIDGFELVDAAPATTTTPPPTTSPTGRSEPPPEVKQTTAPPPVSSKPAADATAAQPVVAESNVLQSTGGQAAAIGGDQIWYCWVGGREHGPVSLAQLRQWVAQRWLSPHDYLKVGPDGAWFAAALAEELFPAVAQPGQTPSQHGGQHAAASRPLPATAPATPSRQPQGNSPAPPAAGVVESMAAQTDQRPPAEANPQPKTTETTASAPTRDTSQSAEEVYKNINAQAIRSITEAAKSGGNRPAPAAMKKPTPATGSPPPVAAPPAPLKTRLPRFNVAAQLARIGQAVARPKVLTVAGILVMVVVGGFLWSRLGGGSDREKYETLVAIFEEFQRTREANASAAEWDQFSRQTIERLQPMIASLDKSASRRAPHRQNLLWAAKDCLPQMLNDARTEESESERQFIGYLEEARRLIAGED
jgi:hypothetical protein